jgi:hypothetical protein
MNNRPLDVRMLPLLLILGLMYPLFAYAGGRGIYIRFVFHNARLVVFNLVGWAIVLRWVLRQLTGVFFLRGTGEKLRIAATDLAVPATRKTA